MSLFLGNIDMEGFSYPQEYINFLNSETSKDFEPWVMLAHYEKRVDLWRNILSEQYPVYSLIPFAKYVANDDVACFDAERNDIAIINSFSTIDSSCQGVFENFETWLKHAQHEHATWDEDDDE